MFGENGGLIYIIHFFCQELFDDIDCVKASIVVNKKPWTLLYVTGSYLTLRFHETGQNFNVPCSIHCPAIMRTVNRRSSVTNSLTFPMFSWLTYVIGLSLRGLTEILSRPSQKRANHSYVHFMDRA
ncbi:hypothetical protein TNCV_68911 [Trichonephila clavipes]|nr:hypothetical protein TNCV_68911 [Trichonephila clavipes]